MVRGSETAASQPEKGKSAAEATLLATIEELCGTIRDLRAEIAALRKATPTQKATKMERAASPERRRERRPNTTGTPTATQRTQLAQATTKPSYAEVTESTA